MDRILRGATIDAVTACLSAELNSARAISELQWMTTKFRMRLLEKLGDR
jgi:hypothetical protein